MIKSYYMFFIMIIIGLIATMNIFANQLTDIRLTLNDLYMSLFMTGLMFLLMGIFSYNKTQIIVGIIIGILSFIAIRKQLFINQEQYLSGMIPHHSMAIFLSKQILEKPINPQIQNLAKNIIQEQTKEINWIKNYLDNFKS